MNNVHCPKCKLEASSKCPHCRSIFVEYTGAGGMMVQALQNRLVFFHSEKNVHTYRITGIIDENDEQTLLRFLNSAAELTEDERKQLCCLHDWQFKKGCKSTIGCGHG